MRNILYSGLCLLFTACIENDIPYPIVEARLTGIAVENMIEPVRINTNSHTVTLSVGDSVNLKALRITKLTYSDVASLSIPDERYSNKEKFPSKPFESLSELPLSADTRVDLSKPLPLVLNTYQEYPWTVTATQTVERKVMVEGQVGTAVIDPESKSVVIYVSKGTKISSLKVSEFSLGGRYGSVVPNPADDTVYPDGFDFTENSKFYVKHGWEDSFAEWRVFVYNTDQKAEMEAKAFARTVSATLTVTGASASTKIEYQKNGDAAWAEVPSQNMSVSNGVATVELQHLSPKTTYKYKVGDGLVMGSFTTTEATPLPNATLDNWTQTDKLWTPCGKGEEKFWDTGNKGATTIAESNSCPTDDTWNSKGKAACLESKFLVLKFAAGNLFTGEYVKTDGTNGVLDFGRPFSAFPTKLRFHYKYRGSTINRVGDDELSHLKGTPDIGTVYVILADWDKPFTIRTRKSERSLLDVQNDEHIIGYGVMETSETTNEYKEYTINIDYRVKNRTPKYIVVVASSSKYGDYFVGGDTSCLWVDDFELLYE